VEKKIKENSPEYSGEFLFLSIAVKEGVGEKQELSFSLNGK